MDLLIPNNWLKKHLDTKATPEQIAKYLSLCGPSIERTTKTTDGDYIYSVEVTTNRVDTASVAGIAREASVILPRFGIKAKLLKQNNSNHKQFNFTKKVKYLDVKIDKKLCPRFTAVLIRNVKVKKSPEKISSLLKKVGVRPINNIVDVSNFIMHDLGQPVHTFDYDKIRNHQMNLRISKKGEAITTLDEQTFKLGGGNIVIEDEKKKLIDLCGIMGGENSAIDENTKNVLLFVQNYDKHKIRKTSMELGLRTEAATLFEKGLDSEMVQPAIIYAIELIEKLSGGKAEKEILDIYPKPYMKKSVTATKNELDKIIGIEISENEITNYLTNLGFEVSWKKEVLTVDVPSWRSDDIDIPEDIAEEVARIYGYHNLPCVLMDGELPDPILNPELSTQKIIKNTLKELKAYEVYNLSFSKKGKLKLKNPLWPELPFMRGNPRDSLVKNIEENTQEKGFIHFFEISNIYLTRKNNLPLEKLILGGIISKGNYRKNKGIAEKLLEALEVNYDCVFEDSKGYYPNQRTVILSGKKPVGEYGNLENGMFYYEFSIEKLIKAKKIVRKYQDVPKYPPQIEDITLVLPEKTKVGEVVNTINSVNHLIKKTELKEIYKDAYTFNIWYQDSKKTLNNKEVEKIRKELLKAVKSKFGAILKD